ncbi:MAG: helix-turn-helix domain-containing protein [Opitutaceae bacterium]|jgi:transcriptional regulator with XRE-family HTH domain|nr:helix-turn-helix domain-containing protein [Opitutaceae bacterium]
MPRPFINVSGPVIRKLRESRDWSQGDLAAKCQLAGWDAGRDIIARIEGRVRLVRDFEIRILADVFQVTPNDLLPRARQEQKSRGQVKRAGRVLSSFKNGPAGQPKHAV